MTNKLKKTGSFEDNALVTLDHYASLFIVELNKPSSQQSVIATEINMTEFIGVCSILFVFAHHTLHL